MSLSDYFRNQAAWRSQKADEYPDDSRNAQSADALYSLAEYVEGDQRGGKETGALVAALEQHLFDATLLGGPSMARAVSRYGFGHKVSPMTHLDFLDELTVLCMEDAYEFAQEHGEDPSGTLYPVELAAARDDVHLPRYYFERRSRWLEREVEEVVAQYRDAT